MEEPQDCIFKLLEFPKSHLELKQFISLMYHSVYQFKAIPQTLTSLRSRSFTPLLEADLLYNNIPISN